MNPKKHEYRRPTVTDLGTLAELTLAGSDGRDENPATHATKGPLSNG